jgi:hypothetical protein
MLRAFTSALTNPSLNNAGILNVQIFLGVKVMSIQFIVPHLPIQIKFDGKVVCDFNLPLDVVSVNGFRAAAIAASDTALDAMRRNQEAEVTKQFNGKIKPVEVSPQPALPPPVKPKPKIEYEKGPRGAAKQERHEQILQALAKDSSVGKPALAELLGAAYATILSDFAELRKAGLINADGTVGPKLNWAELKRRVDAGETLQEIYGKDYSDCGILYREFKKRAMHMFKKAEATDMPLSEKADGQADLSIIQA